MGFEWAIPFRTASFTELGKVSNAVDVETCWQEALVQTRFSVVELAGRIGAGAGGGTRLLPRSRRAGAGAKAGTWVAGRNRSGVFLRDFWAQKK
jgi:hypothetical protein